MVQGQQIEQLREELHSVSAQKKDVASDYMTSVTERDKVLWNDQAIATQAEEIQSHLQCRADSSQCLTDAGQRLEEISTDLAGSTSTSKSVSMQSHNNVTSQLHRCGATSP